jgi:hypothetical protein
MDNPVYVEEVKLTQWATIMLGIFIAALTPTAILEMLAVHMEPSLLWMYVVFDLFFIAMMLNFRKMSIKIDTKKLIVSFGVIKKTVRLADVAKCERINASLGVFTGMGIRYGGDSSLAFLPRLGDAIKLSMVSGRPFVFSSNNIEKIIEVLTQYCGISTGV